MKQTAVEWLVDWMNKNNGSTSENLYNAFEQAKQIEKQQIINAYKSGRNDVINKNNINPIQYYNETFKEII